MGMGGASFPVQAEPAQTCNVLKLFTSGRDDPELAAITEQLQNAAPELKQLRSWRSRGRPDDGSGEEGIENKTLNFFLKNFSLRAN